VSSKVTIVTRNRGTYQLKRSAAAKKVRRESLSYEWLDDYTIVEVEPLPAQQLAILFWDGLLGTGNVLPFAKPNNYGDKLHYEVPMAGDRTTFARHRRHLLHPSSRNLFARQAV
jgi:hypothetical protein